MRPAWTHHRLWLGVSLLLLSIPLWGQSGTERTAESSGEERTHLGYPQDWSSSHLLMPGVRTDDVWAARTRDPRHIYNMVMREVAERNARRGIVRHRPRPVKVDWAVSLENGFVPPNRYPSKYRFDLVTEDCNSDYALFGLTVTSGTQANLVGINNLYTEATPKCNGGTPWVAFAYNTAVKGGQIATSPTLSVNGTKVAFVESTGSATYFHVLVLPNPIPTPPLQTGSVLSPQTPTTCAAGPTVVGCMTTLLVTSASTDSNSSPWIDYNTDTAYVGTDSGVLYKIAPVFNGGAPALVNDAANWPVTVSNQTNSILTDPIEDITAGRLYLGDGTGYLYAVSLTNPAKTYSARQPIGWVEAAQAGTGIVDPPTVVTDPANPGVDQVFAFTGCSEVQGIGGAISQIPANFSNSTGYTTVDLGSGHGNGDCTSDNMHSGTFDNQFWMTGTKGAHMIACGFVDGNALTPLIPSNPQMYVFPFNTNHLITSTGSSTFVINNTVGDECSPLTEFFDGTTDRLFFGVGGSKDGFLESSVITSSVTTPNCTGTPTSSCVKAPSALGGTSGIVVDNQLSNGGSNIYFTTLAPGGVNSQKCNVKGGTANPYCAVKLTQSALQ